MTNLHDLRRPHQDAVRESLRELERTVRDELRRADSKATTLLSLATAALAGVIALTGRTIPIAAEVLLWAAAGGLGGAVLVLLATIRPNLGAGNGTQAARGTWLHAAHTDPDSLLAALTDTCDDLRPGHDRNAATDLCVIAALAAAKYRRIRRAVALLIGSLPVLAIAGLLAFLTGVNR